MSEKFEIGLKDDEEKYIDSCYDLFTIIFNIFNHHYEANNIKETKNVNLIKSIYLLAKEIIKNESTNIITILGIREIKLLDRIKKVLQMLSSIVYTIGTKEIMDLMSSNWKLILPARVQLKNEVFKFTLSLLKKRSKANMNDFVSTPSILQLENCNEEVNHILNERRWQRP
jgi:hypothetical protein